MPKPRLRTKTGCLTCRRRRLKCDEARPLCHHCSIGPRQCDWPTSSDLYDGRYRYCRRSGDNDHGISVTPTWHELGRGTYTDEAADLQLLLEDGLAGSVQQPSSPLTQIYQYAGLAKNPTMQTTLRSDLEVLLFRYWLDDYLDVLLLRDAHPGFYAEYQSSVARLVLTCDSVKCAILACCASNKFMLTNDLQLRTISLKYYAQAMRQVNTALATSDWACESPSDPLLTTVMNMYITALWGSDLLNDAPKHVVGAMQLLKLRYNKINPSSSSSLSMTRPFDRIMTESVLYQAILLSIRHPFKVDFEIDHHFLESTEHILESPTFLDVSSEANSPVLGVPLPLYRLILDVIHLGSSPAPTDPGMFSVLKTNMKYWENMALEMDLAGNLQTPSSTMQQSCPHRHPYSEAVALYALAASLLLDWTAELREQQSDLNVSYSNALRIPSLGMSHLRKAASSSNEPRQPAPPEPRSWQLVRALDILRQPSMHENWTRSFLGWWPMLIFGYATNDDEDIELIRFLLRRMRQRIGYGLVDRALRELEAAWLSRREHGMARKACHDEVLS